MSGRSRLSPSHSKTWLNCPGSIQFSEGLPDTSSEASREGTDAHELAALCLTMGDDTQRYLGRTLPNGNEVDAEMAEYVQVYLDYCRSMPGEHLVETRVDLSAFYGEEGGGTADFIAIDKDICCVADLKYGKGVAVSAENNPQLRIYASGVIRHIQQHVKADYKPATVRMAIIQPRVEGGLSVEEISYDDLAEWTATVLIPGAEATRDPDAPLTPGDDQCKWCKAKGICPALAHHAVEVTGALTMAEFEDLTQPPAPIAMSSGTIGLVLDKAALVRQWLDAVEAEAKRRLTEGNHVPGYKLVKGRAGNRKWDETAHDAISAVLRNNCQLDNASIYKLELLSPTQIMKLPAVKGKEDLLSAFIVRSEGVPVIAPAADKRDAIDLPGAIATEFSVLID